MRARYVLALAVLATAVVYVKVLRPRAMRWGATDEEVARPLPGDRVVHDPGFNATRAITIGAAPEHVWPWIVQMGSGRAGWYAYDRIDNGGMPSAATVVHAFQDLRVGDLIPMAVGKEVGPRVIEIDPNRRMLWATGEEFTWEWVLEAMGEGSTRLVTRIREVWPSPFSLRAIYALVASTGDIVMIRKQLRGIKERAERLGRGAPQTREVLT
jgi:hypothetical protein